MIHIFLGTKAQLIKMAPIMKELQNRGIEYNFIFSGQHQETISDLRSNFGIKEPDYVLYKGKDITGIFQMFMWLLKILTKTIIYKKSVWKDDKNGIVLNHGDTFSTLAGSFLAKIHGHKTAHIESGLRSFNLFHPFPEELTRIAVFKLTDYYFCPNEWALNNVKKYSGTKITTNGNTLYDALKSIENDQHPSLQIPNERYAVASIHRFENIFNKKSLEKIIEILLSTADNIKVLMIAHKPTIKKLEEYNLLTRLSSHKNIEIRPRYDYSKFIKLVIASEFVMTDGGSNQEECFYLGKPCLILRNATERSEGIGENAVISQFDYDVINNFTHNNQIYAKTKINISPSPTEIIVEDLINKPHH